MTLDRPDEDWLTTRAAQELRIKPGTLNKWRWLGRGPRYSYVGRTVIYKASDVRAWIHEQGGSVDGARYDHSRNGAA